MQQYLKINTIGIICGLLFLPTLVIADDSSKDHAKYRNYPKTVQERDMEQMGSLLGGEGVVFRPGRIKNESTKTTGCNVNKYLWQASIETLSFAPLASTDSIGGVIITEWYTPKNNSNFRFKINVFIKDNVISPDAIQVRIFEQSLKNGNWVDQQGNSDLVIHMENKILSQARSLYIASQRK